MPQNRVSPIDTQPNAESLIFVGATAAVGHAVEGEPRVKVEKVSLSYPKVGIYVEAVGCAD